MRALQINKFVIKVGNIHPCNALRFSFSLPVTYDTWDVSILHAKSWFKT